MHPLQVDVRPLRPGDIPALRALFHRWSDQSRYERFFCMSPRIADDYVDALLDPGRTLFAVVAVSPAGKVVGVGSTHRESADTGEFGLAVDDEEQGHGVGTRLLAALLGNAARMQLTTLVAYVEAVNHHMLEVVTDELPGAARELRDGIVMVTVPVQDAIRRSDTHLREQVPS